MGMEMEIGNGGSAPEAVQQELSCIMNALAWGPGSHFRFFYYLLSAVTCKELFLLSLVQEGRNGVQSVRGFIMNTFVPCAVAPCFTSHPVQTNSLLGYPGP